MGGVQGASFEALAAAFRLACLEGLGAVGMNRIRQAFVSAEDLLTAGRHRWQAAGISERLWPNLESAAAADVGCRVARLLAQGGWAVTLFDDAYPHLLKEIHDPPPVLFGLGQVAALLEPCVAVVGARRATRYGEEHAYRIVRGLVALGYTIVSGLAVGIDAVAHRAALAGNGRTVGVLGSGLDVIYPGTHRDLAERMANRGALVSEFLPETQPEPGFFPRRNRIISGLSRAIVIVEAREQSGSLITARQALDQGREVFVVPGPAGGPNLGGHRLLAEGAGWAESAEDIDRVLQAAKVGARQTVGDRAERPGATSRDTPAPDMPPEWQAVWSAIVPGPVHVDEIIERSGLRSSDVLGILLQLELRGYVRQQAGKHFVKT